MTRALAIVALLLVSACSGRPDRISLDATVAVSPQFDAEASESVLNALAAWEAASGHRFAPTLRIGDYEGCTLYIHPGSFEGALGDTELDADRANMVVDLELNAKAARQYHQSAYIALQDTVMHELGHAFGLEHTPGGLMRATGFGGAAVDADTLRRFEENYR